MVILIRNLNFILIFLILSLLTVIYTSSKYPDLTIIKILKSGIEASLVGFIADSYAVYGLFYKLGPHTNLILRKRKSVENKVIEFINNFLISKEAIKAQLKNVEFDLNVHSYINRSEIREGIKNALILAIRKKEYEESKELKFGAYLKATLHDLAEKFLISYLDKNLDSIIDEFLKEVKKDEKFKNLLNDEIKENFIKVLTEKHDLITEIVKKRFESVSDKEFIEAVKKALWDELQWIRLNGTILGFFIGMLLGIVNLVYDIIFF